MKKRHIIIGTSAAGIGAAQKLRQLDQESEILCISDEAEFPYNKCFFADYLASRKQQYELFTKKHDFFEKNNIKLLLKHKVISLEPEKKVIKLHTGESYSYDTLFLGLGRKAPSCIQSFRQLSGFFVFNALSDILALENYIQEKRVRSVFIIGAGLTGIECADALQKYSLVIHLIDAGENVLSSLADTHGAARIENAVRSAGIVLHTKKTIKNVIRHHNTIIGVELDDGTSFAADMVICAVAGPINSALAFEAGLEVDEHSQAIVTNEFLQTSDEHIYAGGDAILIYEQLHQKKMPSCLWPDAMLQGAIAAQNMAGVKKAYPGAVLLAHSSFFGLNFASCGPVTHEKHAYTVLFNNTPDLFAKYLIEENTLKGFLCIGKHFNLSSLRRALLTQEPISHLLFES